MESSSPPPRPVSPSSTRRFTAPGAFTSPCRSPTASCSSRSPISRRLAHSAEIIELTLPAEPEHHPHLDPGRGEGVRPARTARSACSSWAPTTAAIPCAFIWAQPPNEYPPAYYTSGATAITFEARRYLPEAKSLNALASFMAQRARQGCRRSRGFALPRGSLTEGSNSNLFAVDRRPHRHPAASRGAVRRHARYRHPPGPGERHPGRAKPPLAVDEIGTWQECFITSTSRHVMPVSTIDGRPVGPGTAGPGDPAPARAIRNLFPIPGRQHNLLPRTLRSC